MIDPEIARFVAESDRFYPADAALRPLADQRRLYEAYASTFKVRRPPGVTSQDGTLVLPDRVVRLRLYRPARTRVRGIVAYAHGGGFVLGSLDSHDGIVARVSDAVGAPVVAIDYRLAPEHPYPASLDDVRDVVEALCEGRSPWPDLPASPVAMLGDSAGGTLCCMAALELGRACSNPLRALGLIYPMLGYEPAEPARTRWANAPMLTLGDVHVYRSAFFGPGNGTDACPLDRHDLSALPPTILLPAAVDPLRDDCTALAGRLRALGTEVVLLPGTGLVHGALRALDQAAAIAGPFARLCAFLSARLIA